MMGMTSHCITSQGCMHAGEDWKRTYMRSRQVLSAGEESRRISWWKVVVGRSGEGRGWKAGMGGNNEARQGSSGIICSY